MSNGHFIAIVQATLIVLCTIGVWHYSTSDDESQHSGNLVVVDSNDIEHRFEESPSRVVITNTYAGTVLSLIHI